MALTHRKRQLATNVLLSTGALGALLIIGLLAQAGHAVLAAGTLVALCAIAAGAWGLRTRARSASVKIGLQRQRIAELNQELMRDPLTGHLNRSAFNRALHGLNHNSHGNTMIALYFFDLNRFKEVNDTLGHEIGDQLLREVGERAASVLDGCVALARLGGDEFAAIMRYRDDDDVRQTCQALIDAISRPYVLSGRLVDVSAAVGVAVGDPVVHGGDELLRRADVAMYEVKGSGIGAFHIFDDLLSNRQLRESSIRAEIGKARFDERFQLHYQPIIEARTGRIAKAEALLRSRGDAMSGVSPALMVSVAEDSGQIVGLTEWTIDTALAAAKRLEVPVAVNLSPIYFRHPNFANRLIERLVATGAHPSSLIVEVTEGVMISDIRAARESIDFLRAVGVQVYLDDFGTGYSSLSYLQNFELDGMKLDRSFIQDIGKSDKAMRIIRAMIDFAHSLNMQTVIEGVESEWQARMLQLQGCDFLQGYELGIPMPCGELLGRIQANIAQEDAGGTAASGIRASA